MANEIATTPQFDLSPQTFEQALTFANYMAESDMVPKDFKGKPGNCLIAMQWGFEIGLKPLQALQGIAVINGRPSIWGDALLALVLSSPVCKDVKEFYEGTGEDYKAVCVAMRHNRADKRAEFSVKDAKAAGLLGKAGPWTQYRDRMLKQRARAFALRDQFADIIKGLQVAEESMDVPPPAEKHMGLADVVQPEKAETYPEDQFTKNLPAWKKVIAEGRKTPDQIIAMAQTKFPLTEEQQKAIRTVGKAAATPAAPAAAPAPDVSQETNGVVLTYAQVADMISKSQDIPTLEMAGDAISSVQDPEHRKELNTLWEVRSDELNGKTSATA